MQLLQLQTKRLTIMRDNAALRHRIVVARSSLSAQLPLSVHGGTSGQLPLPVYSSMPGHLFFPIHGGMTGGPGSGTAAPGN